MTASSKEILLKQYLLELLNLFQLAENEREKGEETLDFVNQENGKLRSGQRLPMSSINKLKSKSSKLITDSEKQLELYQMVLDKIQQIRTIEDEIKFSQNATILRRGVLMSMLLDNGRALPLWMGKSGEKIPGLCGCIPIFNNEILPNGTKIAALVRESDPKTSDTSSEEINENVDSWILAKVIQYNNNTSLYDVEDIDVEEGKEQYSIDSTKIIPLPRWKADPRCYPEALFKNGDIVLGLYPQTTCFYKAVVHESPTNAHEEYGLFFEDSSYPEGFAPALKIPQKYVITTNNILGNQCVKSDM